MVSELHNTLVFITLSVLPVFSLRYSVSDSRGTLPSRLPVRVRMETPLLLMEKTVKTAQPEVQAWNGVNNDPSQQL